MEDNDLLRFILLAAFYGAYQLFRLIGRGKDKKKAGLPADQEFPYEEEDDDSPLPEASAAEPPPRSREEYLRRLEEANARAEAKAAEKQKALKRQLQEKEAGSLTQMDNEVLRRMYQTEKMKAQQERLPAKSRKTTPVQSTTLPVQPVKRKKKPQASARTKRLKRMLQNQDELRNAIILSEILKRKY